MSGADRPRLLVTGAGGQPGRRVLTHLAALGATDVVAASSNPAALSLPSGFEARHIDFDDAATLAPAFAGIDRVLFISTDLVETPELQTRSQIAAVQSACRSGVSHLLYTSILNPERCVIPSAKDHQEVEKAIVESGCSYSILRVSCFTEALLGTAPGALASGTWATSSRNRRANYVTHDDTARVAAAALAKRTGVREHLDITGPVPMSIEQIAAITETICACPIDVTHVSDEALAKDARSSGVAESSIPLLVAMDASIRAGQFDISSTVIEDLTGKPATSVGAFLSANKVMLNT